MKTIQYGIVGDGSVATHIAYYLELEKIQFQTWSRRADTIAPVIKLEGCTTVLLLISDDAIETFIEENPLLKQKELIHFSGSLTVNGVIAYHPLMSFGDTLYTHEEYQEIPFIGVQNSKPFIHIFPQLKNSYHSIKEEEKQLYHALCVLSGNLTVLLWQKASKDFEQKLNLPKELLNPYLNQICSNLKIDPFTALSGPIKRQDRGTMKRNRKSLKGRTWRKIYSLFNRAYKEELK